MMRIMVNGSSILEGLLRPLTEVQLSSLFSIWEITSSQSTSLSFAALHMVNLFD